MLVRSWIRLIGSHPTALIDSEGNNSIIKRTWLNLLSSFVAGGDRMQDQRPLISRFGSLIQYKWEKNSLAYLITKMTCSIPYRLKVKLCVNNDLIKVSTFKCSISVNILHTYWTCLESVYRQLLQEERVKGLGIVTCAVFIVGEIAGSGVLALPAAVEGAGEDCLCRIVWIKQTQTSMPNTCGNSSHF